MCLSLDMIVFFNLFVVVVKGGQKGSQNFVDNVQQVVNGYRYNSINVVDDFESIIDDVEINKVVDEIIDFVIDIDEVVIVSFVEGNIVMLVIVQIKYVSSIVDIVVDFGYDVVEQIIVNFDIGIQVEFGSVEECYSIDYVFKVQIVEISVDIFEIGVEVDIGREVDFSISKEVKFGVNGGVGNESDSVEISFVVFVFCVVFVDFSGRSSVVSIKFDVNFFVGVQGWFGLSIGDFFVNVFGFGFVVVLFRGIRIGFGLGVVVYLGRIFEVGGVGFEIGVVIFGSESGSVDVSQGGEVYEERSEKYCDD